MYARNSVREIKCIGHVQKCVGGRLGELKKTAHGLGGKGKLKDQLKNYYSIAIRANVGNPSAMKQATLSSLFHCSSAGKHSRDSLCPLGLQSWCGYRIEALHQAKYVHKGGLSSDVLNKVKTVYNDFYLD